MVLTKYDIARLIDLSCVQARNTLTDIQNMVHAAKEHQVICVHSLPCNVLYVKELLQGEKDVLLGCPVGFPAGGNNVRVKIYELEKAIEDGVQEIDVVMNIGWIVSENYDAVEKELSEIIRHAQNVPIKALMEVSLLSDGMIETASKIAVNAGAAFVKTGTGWNGKPTSYHDIQVIRQAVGEQIKIKASGGIRGLDMLLNMYKLGASRFGVGLTHAIDILDEMKKYPDGVVIEEL